MSIILKFLGAILIVPIKIYQWFISPVLPNSCRHTPTCSNYAIEAIRIHGPFKGFYLGIRRILRCHPWGTHGYDPVPPKKQGTINTKAAIVVVILTVISLSCNSEKPEPVDIAVSIAPQKFIIDKLTGSSKNVLTLIPSGANPHTYELTAKQAKSLNEAKLYIQIGHFAFEEIWYKRFKSINNTMRITALDDGLVSEDEASHEDHDTHFYDHVHENDPHVWMSVKNMQIISIRIYQELVQLYSKDSVILSANFKKWQKELSLLDSTIATQLSPFNNKNILIYHPTLTYFTQDYNMTQTALEKHGKEPGIKYLKEIITRKRSISIPVIFIQKEIDVDNILSISNELNWPVIEINPLNYDWDKEILSITNAIINAK